MSTVQKTKPKRKNLFETEAVYIFWFVFYIVFTFALLSYLTMNILLSAFITVGVYVVSLSVAVSPFGEELFKFVNGVRPVYTNREREKIMPIYDEVYRQIYKLDKNTKKDITLCLSDSLIPNAYAIGQNTIVVTKGLIESMNPAQIRGALAHEFGHHAYGDPYIALVMFIGNAVVSFTIMLVRKALAFVIALCDSVSKGAGIVGMLTFGVVALVFRAIQLLFDLIVFVVEGVSNIMLAMKSRYDEHRADKYAFQMKYGEELVSMLYEIETMASGRAVTVEERLRSSHPHVAKRIYYLEWYLEQQHEKEKAEKT